MIDAGMVALSPHAENTEYCGRREQQFMVNFRVRDLDAILAQLRAAGVNVEEVQE